MLQTWRPISQSLPAANIMSKECWIDHLAVLVLDFTVLPVSLPIFEPGSRVGISHLATHSFTCTVIRIGVLFNETFSLLPYVFNHILCGQIERFDLPMALLMPSSNFNLQSPTCRAQGKNCSEYQQKSLTFKMS